MAQNVHHSMAHAGREGRQGICPSWHESFRYPGDEVIYKALGEALRALRLEKGLSLEQAEQAFREALTAADPKATYRALGLTLKEARESRKCPAKN